MSNAVTKEYDIFISYKSQEREEACHIKRFLESNGLTCWMDQDKIRISEDYKEVITSVMAKCRGLILMLSYHSQQSIEVKKEYLWAKESGLDIYPVKIKKCELTPEYEKWLRHTQTAMSYWTSEREKQKVLRTIRDLVYERKGEPVKTEEEYRNQRIAYYKKKLRKEFKKNTTAWEHIIRKSVERCRFCTPEPHLIKGTILKAIEPYQDLVDIYINDVIEETHEKRVEYKTRILHLKDFCNFIIQYDLITDIWLSFDCYARIALKELTYLDDDPIHKTFLLCLYKDYLNVLNGESCAHPIVKLCSKLAKEDPIVYELLMSYLTDENQPAFIREASLAVYIHPRYIGEEYINIGGQVDVQEQRKVFPPDAIVPPHWSDFMRRLTADMLLEDLDKCPGATKLTSFFVGNALFTCDEKLNPLYYYLINRWIESGHVEYVNIFLRYAESLEWEKYTPYPDEEKHVLQKFYSTCMLENGHEQCEIKQIW